MNLAKQFITLASIGARTNFIATMARQLAANTPEASSFVRAVYEKAEPGMTDIGGSPTPWAAPLASDRRLLASAWLGTLRHVGFFDAVAAAAIPAAFKMMIPISVADGAAPLVAEGDTKPVSDMVLTSMELTPYKTSDMVVVTEDLLKLVSALDARLESEMRKKVIAGTDLKFLTDLIAVTTPTPSSGDILIDLQTMLAVIQGGSTSRYFLAIDPAAARNLATTPGVNGPAYPGFGVSGGTLAGVTVVVSDQLDGLPANAVLVDASQIAVVPGDVNVGASRQSTIDLNAGGSPSNVVSLWQHNMRAILVERFFGFAILNDSAVASVSGAEYSVGSP